MIHIGDLIKSEIKKSGQTIKSVRESAGIERRTMDNLLVSESIDTSYLMSLSIALSHDFFAHYSQELHLQSRLSPTQIQQIRTCLKTIEKIITKTE